MTALSMGLSPVSPMVLTSQTSAGWHPELLSPVFHAGGFHPGSRRLWQDHTGLTLAEQAGQTLGRLQSRRGSLVTLQADAALRPVLVRWPKGGRQNMMPGQTEAPSLGANWDGYGVDLSAGFLSEKAVATEHNAFLRQTVAFGPVGTEVTISLNARHAGAHVLQISLGSQWFGLHKFANFDLLTGIARATGCSASMSPAGEGWLISLSATTTAEPSGGAPFAIALTDNQPEAGRVPAYPGIAGRGLHIGQVNVNIGPRVPYQEVRSPTEVLSPSQPERWHLLDDGDHLPVILPAGAYEMAFTNHLGVVGYAAITSDGLTGTDILRKERLGDVLIKAGSLSGSEKEALEAYWQAKFTT